jgi:protein TorT
VVAAVNPVNSADTSARVLTNPRDEALHAGQYLARKHPAGSKPVKVAWLPGPAGAGFVEAFTSGFREGIKGSAVTIAETKHGDVGKEVQARLVEDVVQTHKDLDYIAGTAVMVEAAAPVLKARKLGDKVRLVSVYMTPGTLQLLKVGDIDAAGAAPVALLGRMMLDTAVRLLEKKLEFTDVNTLSQVYTKADVGTLVSDTVLAPASYKPVFRFGGK